MFKRLLRTDGSVAALVLRLTLAVVMFPHGAQKVFGIWGGHGFGATLEGFSKMGIPTILTVLDIAAEFLGPIFLLLGFLTRVASFGIAVVMAVAVVLVHFENGFFMNWTGKQAGEGIEYHILVFGIALSLMISGGGRASVDGALSKRGTKL